MQVGECMRTAGLKSEVILGGNSSSTGGHGWWYLYSHFPQIVCSLICLCSIQRQKAKFPLFSILQPSLYCLVSHLGNMSHLLLPDTTLVKDIPTKTLLFLYLQVKQTSTYRNLTDPCNLPRVS